MQSVLIEYFRFDNLDSGVLAGGKRYVLAHKDHPVKEVATPLNQKELLDKLSDCLRYETDLSNEEKWNTIVEISGKLKELFISMPEFNYRNSQLDVVLNASELGLLPFELMLDENQVPYFADANRRLTLTRRMRQDQFEIGFNWPYTPKVLFVYAHGGGKEVPFSEHEYELDKALSKWGGISKASIFNKLPEPSFEAFAEELRNNDTEKKHYTHIHILAHGDLIIDRKRPYDFEYGIVFGKGKDGPTPTQSIKELFEGLQHKPFFVNFMICDGANFSNPIKPDKNPVQVTHRAGVPVVLGSQYPLSMDGSVLITKRLYTALFNGEDIRTVLHRIRVELFGKKENHHDWISLVSYVRLPEGYNDYLYKILLYLQMQKLKHIRSQTDQFLGKKEVNKDDFIESMAELSRCIQTLELRLEEIKDNRKYEEDLLENLGLLGSSYKRMAELYHFKSQVMGASAEDAEKERTALSKAMEYYKKACDRNLSHHWTLVQYLSLDAVLNGAVADRGYWFAAHTSIRNCLAANAKDGWAYGSLIELLLLDQSEKNQENKKPIQESVTKLKEIARDKDDPYLIESTWQQLNRYNTWWTDEKGYGTGKQLLVADKGFLKEIMQLLKS